MRVALGIVHKVSGRRLDDLGKSVTGLFRKEGERDPLFRRRVSDHIRRGREPNDDEEFIFFLQEIHRDRIREIRKKRNRKRKKRRGWR